MRRLHIYKDGTHPHEAQTPEILDVSVFNSKNKR